MGFVEAVSRRSRLAKTGSALACVLLLLSASTTPPARALSSQARRNFQKSIIDKRSELDRRFKKVRRKQTKYIIVHTSEGGLQNTLNVVLNGKHERRRRLTYGGHAHYVIARDGRTYRTLDKKYRADHAGRSMWNGRKDISSISIGIELVGYHHTNITSKQYLSLSALLEILQSIYKLSDRDVLTHSQVAYGRPNRWVRSDHRGRKRCAKNFDRRRAALGPTWERDPDVVSGRLTPDRELAAIYYGPGRTAALSSNVITGGNSAWMIAGEDYNAPTTLYRLPSGRVIPGDRMGRAVGWRRIPAGTQVLLNEEFADTAPDDVPVATISNGQTAWTFAGADYRKTTTLYIFPNGHVKNGRQITDWDGLPPRTRIIVGYHGPYRITRARPAIKIAGDRYQHKDTLYFFPDKSIVPGSNIRNFRLLPPGVHIFLPANSS